MIWVLCLSPVVLALSSFLFHKASGSLSLSKLNIVSWIFYFQLMLLSFIGINLGVMGVYHYVLSRASASSLLLAYFSVCYTLIMMPVAMILFQKYISRVSIRAKLNSYYQAQVRGLQSNADKAQVFFWFTMTILSVFGTLYVYANIEGLPFLALITSEQSQANLRQSASFQFEGNVYIRNFFALILAQLSSYIAFAYLLDRKTAFYKIWFTLGICTAFFAVTYSGAKAPIMNYLIGLILIWAISKGGFKTKFLFLIFLIGSGIIVAFYATIGQLSFSINTGPIGRILLTQLAGLPLHFEYFPDLNPFLKGASFPSWLSALFGQDHMRSGRVVMTLFDPVAVREGRAGVMNTLFIGEAWANFGWFGFILSPIIVGVVVQFVHNLFLSLPKSPVYVSAMAYFMLQIPITGGFVDFIWNSGWFFLLLIISSSLFVRPVLLNAKHSLLRVGVYD